MRAQDSVGKGGHSPPRSEGPLASRWAEWGWGELGRGGVARPGAVRRANEMLACINVVECLAGWLAGWLVGRLVWGVVCLTDSVERSPDYPPAGRGPAGPSFLHNPERGCRLWRAAPSSPPPRAARTPPQLGGSRYVRAQRSIALQIRAGRAWISC